MRTLWPDGEGFTRNDRLQILLSAGEPSGDYHGARLARVLKKLEPGVQLFGMGGPAMRAEGVETVADAARHGALGLVEVLGRTRRVVRDYRTLARAIKHRRPGVAVAIDYGGFNAKVIARARREGVHTVYYIPPKVWAWNPGRGRRLAKYLDLVICIFGFEPAIWRGWGARAEFVGHPLLDTTAPSARDLRAEHSVPAGVPLVGLLPGSRDAEVARLLPVVVRAAEIIARADPDVRFALGLAPAVDLERVNAVLKDARVPITLERESAVDLMAAADVLVVASGTATLEAAIVGTPMVIVYRVNPVTWEVGKRLARVKHLGLPNIIAGRGIVPELLQREARPSRVAEAVLTLLADPAARAEQKQELARVKTALNFDDPSGGAGRTAAERAAELILKF